MQRPDSKLPQTENNMKIGKAPKMISETNLCIYYKDAIPNKYVYVNTVSTIKKKKETTHYLA